MDDTDSVAKESSFISGVVEGFYGRPWSLEQRKDLFGKLKAFGMNTYVYAPKDDVKHRSCWRELYSPVEEEHLRHLIENAKEHGIAFVYALSPGLDISYSFQKDRIALQNKLEQVQKLGDVSFALFFDDIEPELKVKDKEMFRSFAEAQVSVTNEVYENLGKPKVFLFCPTEYCSSRAIPTVTTSEYLNTLGQNLAPQIDIMWTGTKVISQTIEVDHIQELTSVLKRKPVIWDNLHANDYDQKRLFLGPYSGRSTKLKPYLNGILTNPNCEYEANFIAIYTLAHWTKCHDDCVDEDENVSIEETNEILDDVILFHPRSALREAINEWIPEFYKVKSANVKSNHNRKPTSYVSQTAYEENPNDNKVYLSLNDDEKIDVDDDNLSKAEDMEFAEASPRPPPMEDNVMSEKDPNTDNDKSDNDPNRADNKSMMSVESDEEEMQTEIPELDHDSLLTYEDVELLVDLFYLPYEHGNHGLKMLRDFHWLKVHGYLVSGYRRNKEEPGDGLTVKEWFDRADRFNQMTSKISRLFTRLTFCNNRSLLYELYPYIWDIKGVISLLNSYVKWIGLSDGYKEIFHCNEQEPWLFRGGLTGELQRLLPEESIGDLFLYKAPESPSSRIYTIRPYLPSDEKAIYNICFESTEQRFLTNGDAEMIGDRVVGGILTLSPEYCFVVEDDSSICGFALAVADAKSFFGKLQISWIPELRRKYPEHEVNGRTPWIEKFIKELHSNGDCIFSDPELIFKTYPSFLNLTVMSSIHDLSVPKRMLACLISALKANGSRGVYARVSSVDKKLLDFYIKLGFKLIVFPLAPTTESDDFYLGRFI